MGFLKVGITFLRVIVDASGGAFGIKRGCTCLECLLLVLLKLRIRHVADRRQERCCLLTAAWRTSQAGVEVHAYLLHRGKGNCMLYLGARFGFARF